MDQSTDSLLLIVTGAHLIAEREDRPIAYRLATIIRERLEARFGPATAERPWPLTPLVCSDIWYLNHAELRSQPTISVGHPGVNALAAYLGDKIPSAYAIKDVLVVQCDVEMNQLIASCWGENACSTSDAVEAFCDRYLTPFLKGSLKPLE
jgi:hypothetical protein